MAKNPLITIIVPVYKVEKYLDKCVNSILGQTYTNIEILLIDDGSPDQCGSMCDSYSLLDSRIKVVHKKNGGLSDARNAALDIMTGDYVTFVDSDDYLDVDYISRLYLSLLQNEADISVCNYYFYYERTCKITPAFNTNKKTSVLNNKEALSDLLYKKSMETSAWGKLYSKDIFQNLRYPVGKLYEDIATTYKAFIKAQKVVSISSPLYYYTVRDDSIMGASFDIKQMDAIYMAKDMLNGMISYGDPQLVKAAKCRYVSMCYYILFKTNRDTAEELYIYNEILKYRKDILFDVHTRSRARCAMLFSFLGLNFIRRLNRIQILINKRL